MFYFPFCVIFLFCICICLLFFCSCFTHNFDKQLTFSAFSSMLFNEHHLFVNLRLAHDIGFFSLRVVLSLGWAARGSTAHQIEPVHQVPSYVLAIHSPSFIGITCLQFNDLHRLSSFFMPQAVTRRFHVGGRFRQSPLPLEQFCAVNRLYLCSCG